MRREEELQSPEPRQPEARSTVELGEAARGTVAARDSKDASEKSSPPPLAVAVLREKRGSRGSSNRRALYCRIRQYRKEHTTGDCQLVMSPGSCTRECESGSARVLHLLTASTAPQVCRRGDTHICNKLITLLCVLSQTLNGTVGLITMPAVDKTFGLFT